MTEYVVTRTHITPHGTHIPAGTRVEPDGNGLYNLVPGAPSPIGIAPGNLRPVGDLRQGDIVHTPHGSTQCNTERNPQRVPAGTYGRVIRTFEDQSKVEVACDRRLGRFFPKADWVLVPEPPVTVDVRGNVEAIARAVAEANAGSMSVLTADTEDTDAFKARVVETVVNYPVGCKEGRKEFLNTLGLEWPEPVIEVGDTVRIGNEIGRLVLATFVSAGGTPRVVLRGLNGGPNEARAERDITRVRKAGSTEWVVL